MNIRWFLLPRRPLGSSRGFTLLELLVVLAVVGLVIALGISNFKGAMVKWTIVGDANAVANTLNRARSQALRYNRTVVGEIDPTTHELFFFFDENEDYEMNGNDEEPFPRLSLTTTDEEATSVMFWSHSDATRDPQKAIIDFTTRTGKWPVIVIQRDGSILDLGAFRIGRGADISTANFMEIRAMTAAGRFEIRKYIPGQTIEYQPKLDRSGGGTNWEFR